MFTPPPTPQELAGFGLTAADVIIPVDIWPEHLPVHALFSRVVTQWRVGSGGPTGLDYRVVFRLLDNLQLPQAEWDAWLDDIRVMENEALATLAEGSNSK